MFLTLPIGFVIVGLATGARDKGNRHQ
jgi:hypothetical protein